MHLSLRAPNVRTNVISTVHSHLIRHSLNSIFLVFVVGKIWIIESPKPPVFTVNSTSCGAEGADFFFIG